MKSYAIFALFSFLFGMITQSNDFDDYSKEWKKVEQFEKDGLPRSAWDVVKSIHQKAIKEKNTPQIVKTFIYITRYTQDLEEDGVEMAIHNLEAYIAKHNGVEKQILQSVLGEWYNNYTMQNMHKIQNRTALNDNDGSFTNWSVERLLSESASLYKASIAVKNSKYSLSTDFKSILNDVNDLSIQYRPSVYEILMDRAITHFSNSNAYLTDPVYKFEMDDELYFGDWRKHDVNSIVTKDLDSKLYQGVLIYSEYLNYFKSEKNKLALADLELSYLRFVYQNTTLSNKKELFEVALDRLSTKYRKQAIYSLIQYERAQLQFNKGKNEPLSNDKPHKVVAFEICNQGIDAYPDSFGAYRCKQLIQQIESKSNGVEIEETILIDSDNDIKISYKNINTLYFRIYKLDAEKVFDHIIGYNRKDIINTLGGKLVKIWDTTLPDFKDYEAHTALDRLPKMSSGQYLIQSSDDPSFSEKHILRQTQFQVSDLSYDYTNSHNKGYLVVRSRDSGAPIANATIEIYKTYYNRQQRKNVVEFVQKARSNSDGQYNFTAQSNTSYLFRISHKEDHYFKSDRSYFREVHQVTDRHLAHIFTDRSIYRPGQKVYFKTLLTLIGKDRIPKIVANETVTVTFKDVNYQEIGNLKLKTNAFGTAEGHFNIPQNVLTGNMQIYIHSGIGGGNKHIAVEAYKRPKFEVDLKDLTETYALNDQVTVKGNAKALAGVNLDGAKVQYRVKRTVSYPYYRSYWRMPYFDNNGEMEIAKGETITDADGNFEVLFEAIPNKLANKRHIPLFSFEVTVDVTDLNGETRSDSKTIRLAYHSVQLGVDIPSELDKSTSYDLRTKTTNLDGTPVEVSVLLKIDKLQEPKEVVEQETWGKVDTVLYGDAHKINPGKKESKFEDWLVEKQVFESSYTNTKDFKIKVSDLGLDAGVYKVKLSHQDKSGQALEEIKYVTVTDFEHGKFPHSKLLFTHKNAKKYNQGEALQLDFGSAYDGLWVYYELFKKENVVGQQWIQLGDVTSIKSLISEKDRGGFQVQLSYVLHNKLYTENIQVDVPWSNKELSIEYMSYRDQLDPGSKEEWRIKIKGEKGDQVAAELLASMYDASLDQFANHSWVTNFYPNHYNHQRRIFNGFGKHHLYGQNGRYYTNKSINYEVIPLRPRFKYSLNTYNRRYYSRSHTARGGREMEPDGMMMKSGAPPRNVGDLASSGELAEAATMQDSEDDGANVTANSIKAIEKATEKSSGPVKMRTNLKETVFFYPQLHTNKEGDIEIRFTMNEALTKWKFMTFAHTKDLAYIFDTKEIITRKKLMVFPNAPRFFREGDRIELSTKVSNLSDEKLDVNVRLELFDALTGNDIAILKSMSTKEQQLALENGKSGSISWELNIPDGAYEAIGYRVIAQAGAYSDGEENVVPVVTNRMLVTETMPLPVKAKESKSFVFQSMKDHIGSNTLKNHSYTVEFTSNPVWYAVQALPYILNTDSDCSEYVFNRFFVNTLASHIANSSPKLKAVFDHWSQYDEQALKSNLHKNQALKSVLLEETPWVLDAISEEQQKKNIALLFDFNKMSYELAESLQKLEGLQNYEGGFAWYPGGRANRYITQNIVEGMGHLMHLNVLDSKEANVEPIISKAVQFIDRAIKKQYDELLRQINKYGGDLGKDHLGQMAIHYLYTRSFFKDIPVNKSNKEAYDYYLNQALKYGLNKGVYLDGMVALSLHRSDHQARAKAITKSLAERAMYNEELGMYWKENTGYYWYQLPIERQALLIETFTEVAQDGEKVDLLKTWLLKHKQTNNWKTTKATAAAIYALLLSEPNQSQETVYHLDQSATPVITIGGNPLDLSDVKKEAGTGYLKVEIDKDKINASLAQVEVENKNDNIAWGAIYWQYFEDLDQIKSFKDTPLKLKKKLFKQVITDKGEQLISIDEVEELEVGDKLIVRIELEVDHGMEYVHLKDMRASGLEPINVRSSYKWQDGLGYYESTKDLATHFYMDYLQKGNYVFEYELRVSHKGDFSNGITTIQCMYAPEFTSHSLGRRIQIK